MNKTAVSETNIAKRWGEYSSLYRDTDKIPAAIKDISRIAAAESDYNIVRRWHYLANFLNSYYYEIDMGGTFDAMCPLDADRPDLF